MKYFYKNLIGPYIAESGYHKVCEVGSALGDNADSLLENTRITLTLIDPCVLADLANKYKNSPRVRVFKGLSLQVLRKLSEQFDCILIDGDHNWYTVYNELKLIHQRNLLRPGGTVFFHDVGWPYGRRDLYYLPETVPAEFRHPCAMRGMVPGRSELAESGGKSPGFRHALLEGGPRNGVMTAIEDFLKECPADYLFFRDVREHGLGVLLRREGGLLAYVRFTKYFLTTARRNFIYRLKYPRSLLSRLARGFAT